jgi:hypothetical protein
LPGSGWVGESQWWGWEFLVQKQHHASRSQQFSPSWTDEGIKARRIRGTCLRSSMSHD